MCANLQSDQPDARQGYAPAENAQLFYRQIGQGRPIIILHGGPSFDHTYLLPDMDRLSHSYHLIYYDQRGRGKSTGDVQDITIKTEVQDLEDLRTHLQLDSVAILGHSWGGHLAMEYAICHPDRVSHLILMNTSVASYADYKRFDEELSKKLAVHEKELNALEANPKYQEGDSETHAQYNRIYFSTTIKRPEHLQRLNLTFPNVTKEGVLRARKISEQLTNETWASSEFNLIPGLQQLTIPTLIIHGDYDFIPVECAAHIAQAIPAARFVVLKECGHFSYIESPDEVRQQLAAFFAST